MADEERYRQLAKHCREQAAFLQTDAAALWLKIADEYEKLADGLRAFRSGQQPKPEVATPARRGLKYQSTDAQRQPTESAFEIDCGESLGSARNDLLLRDPRYRRPCLGDQAPTIIQSKIVSRQDRRGPEH
jgi:hypothetical protein